MAVYFTHNQYLKTAEEDFEAADLLFDQLMGTGVTARKEYIKLHSEEAVYNAE